jgi:hypothetical protein
MVEEFELAYTRQLFVIVVTRQRGIEAFARGIEEFKIHFVAHELKVRRKLAYDKG